MFDGAFVFDLNIAECRQIDIILIKVRKSANTFNKYVVPCNYVAMEEYF